MMLALSDVVSAVDPIVRLWPVLSGTFKSLEIGHSLGSVRWSPLGDLLAVTCDDCVTRIIDASGEEVLRLGPHNGPVKAAAWRSDGLQLATGAYDGTVILNIKKDRPSSKAEITRR